MAVCSWCTGARAHEAWVGPSFFVETGWVFERAIKNKYFLGGGRQALLWIWRRAFWTGLYTAFLALLALLYEQSCPWYGLGAKNVMAVLAVFGEF